MEPVTINLLGSFEKKWGQIKKKLQTLPPKQNKKIAPPSPQKNDSSNKLFTSIFL